MRKKRKICPVVLCFALLNGCSSNSFLPIEKSSKKFQNIYELIKQDEINVFEMCQIENNNVYFVSIEGKKEPTKHNLYSISKNFTAIAIGILIDQNKLSLDENIYNIFKDEYKMDEQWQKVNVANVLTQTTGIDKGFLDVDVEDTLIYGDDYLKYILSTKLNYPAGTHFQYSDSNYILLSHIIKKISKMPTQDFIKLNILDKLSIDDYDFQLDPSNNFLGATGLFLSSYSLAKFGVMISNEGQYDNETIVSKEFIKLATQNHVEVDSGTFYGYSFWKDLGIDNVRGSGMLGQILYIDQEQKIVYAIISEDTIGLTNQLLYELKY